MPTAAWRPITAGAGVCLSAWLTALASISRAKVGRPTATV